MTTYRQLITGVAVAALMAPSIAGCASKSSSVKAQYVSDAQYRSYTCDELSDEMMAVRHNVATVAAEQDSAANADAVMMGVGLVLLWPVLIGLAFTEDQAAELGRLKGEAKAVERAAKRQRCTLPEPVEPAVAQTIN